MHSFEWRNALMIGAASALVASLGVCCGAVVF